MKTKIYQFKAGQSLSDINQYSEVNIPDPHHYMQIEDQLDFH